MVTNETNPVYVPAKDRYEGMQYRRCGKSGLKLPMISLGLWHNFGQNLPYATSRALARKAFDLGITHFDLANNYGPPYGAAETTFGRILKDDLMPYRDELVISSKAGFDMWAGPYGDHGSKKYLIASLDQSLKRMGLEYVDIFYHHRPDPDTPIEETAEALAQIVRQGKALYVGISNYQSARAQEMFDALRQLGVHCLIHQPNYSMVNRWVEDGLLDLLEQEGVGAIAFCPLAQGVLTGKYAKGVPADARAAKDPRYLKAEGIDHQVVAKVQRLNQIAEARGQSMAQMALSWVLKDARITSALIGASRPEQIEENVAAVHKCVFTDDELAAIEAILAD